MECNVLNLCNVMRKCLMEPPQTTANTGGEGVKELKINENGGIRNVVEGVDLREGNIYITSGKKMLVLLLLV